MDDRALADLRLKAMQEVKKKLLVASSDVISGNWLVVAYVSWMDAALWKVFVGEPGEIEINVCYQQSCGKRIYLKCGDEDEMRVEDYIFPLTETKTYLERSNECCGAN